MNESSPSGASTRRDVALVAALLGVAFASVLSAAGQGKATFRRSTARTDLDTRVTRTVEHIARELAPADRDTVWPALLPPLSSSDVRLRAPAGFVDGAVAWGPEVAFVRELEPGELDDGIDNDGDGSVDEGVVVRIDEPGDRERRTVLARGVAELLQGEELNGIDDNGNGLIDEPGLCFHILGDALVVRLSLEAPGPDNDRIVRSLETRVLLRN